MVNKERKTCQDISKSYTVLKQILSKAVRLDLWFSHLEERGKSLLGTVLGSVLSLLSLDVEVHHFGLFGMT